MAYLVSKVLPKSKSKFQSVSDELLELIDSRIVQLMKAIDSKDI